MPSAGNDRSTDPPGLLRPRLLAALGRARRRQLALLVAPAGAGKTTLLAQYAAEHAGPVGLAPADRYDLDALAAALAAAPGPSLALLVDNLDCLDGSAAERTLERLALLAPPSLRVVGAGRRMPALNLLRHELSDGLVVIDGDQLRFRTWEVERLPRDVYRQPLPPEEVAVLTRRTGGWAAGLQLFHLSTRGRTLTERRRAVSARASPALPSR